MELEPCRVGLLIANHHGWSNVEPEIDCISVIQVLKGSDADYFEVGRTVEDCREYMTIFNSIYIQHVLCEVK